MDETLDRLGQIIKGALGASVHAAMRSCAAN